MVAVAPMLKVLSINESFTPTPQMGAFDKVIHYQMNSTGFDGITDPAKLAIYEVYEYRWNVKPMALLHVHIEGGVEKFGRQGIEKIGGNLIFGGGLIIDLRLKELARGN